MPSPMREIVRPDVPSRTCRTPATRGCGGGDRYEAFVKLGIVGTRTNSRSSHRYRLRGPDRLSNTIGRAPDLRCQYWSRVAHRPVHRTINGVSPQNLLQACLEGHRLALWAGGQI